MAPEAALIEVNEAVQCCPAVLSAPLDVAQAAELARAFSALADPVRLRALSMLVAAPAGEVCVCDFVAALGKSQLTISHHLKVLGRRRPGARRPPGQVGVVLAGPRPAGGVTGCPGRLARGTCTGWRSRIA